MGILENEPPVAVALPEYQEEYVGEYAKFDGSEWTTYTPENSELPDSLVLCLAVDDRGNKWIGTSDGGLAVYREGGVMLR